ncbi:flagella basal body P-ring formation protein FlgA [Luteibacter sp. Sphag1AF]|uniref:flagellar basal body P-ring formation chaperone FlgA n=1 Tax=Luteibacter sp. Sphag1AF TaxID=2587031 RepID=UPI001612C464|nr:flagellar basal body P-ring formation chaperone FlgA [Luteibacter sp. Sphag1AF]MBB3225618.1 flagella basal body P-ring formation protein FlgA [Luteibacter sp. Sphag1AF]
MTIRAPLLALLCAAPLVLPVVARAGQSMDALKASAVEWLQQNRTLPGARLVAEAGTLDSRLALADCPSRPVFSVPGGRALGARTTVAAQCPGSWTVRIPVRIQMFTQVLVTTRPLARGDGVGANDVHAEERDVASLAYGYVAALDQIDGRSLARPLRAGTVLTPGMLAGRQAVRIGDTVSMVANVEGVVVHAQGVAMGAGDTGTRLRVRNSASGKVLDAVVSGEGVVSVLP